MRYKIVFLTALILACACTSFAWTPEQNLTPSDTIWKSITGVAVDSYNNVHVIYIKSLSSGVWKVYHTYQSGGVFTAPQEVTSMNNKEPEAKLIAGPNGKLYLATLANGGPVSEYTAFFREWNGSSWSLPLQLSDGSGGCNDVRVAVDASGNIHAAWQQTKTGGGGDIMYRKRTGTTWGSVRNLTANNPGTSYGSCSPDIACDYTGSGVHIVWHDDFLNDGFQSFYMKSTDGGATWPGMGGWVMLNDGSYGKVPKIVVDRSNSAHVFWTDRNGAGINVTHYRKCTAGAWGSTIDLGALGIEAIAADSNSTVHLLYGSSATGHYEMYHDWMTATGRSGANEMVSNGEDTCKCAFGSIAVDGSNTVHAAWQERKGGCDIGPYIYYSKGIFSTPPSPVTSLTATATSTSQVGLAWRNPSNTDYAGTTVRYRFDNYPSGPYDGNLLITKTAAPGSNDSATHTGLQSGQFVYYGAFPYNSAGVYGAGAFAGARTLSAYTDLGPIGTGGRPFAMAAAPNGVIYTGTDGTSTVSGTFGKYVVATNTWSAITPFPYTGRVLSLLVGSDGKVYGAQGGDGTNQPAGRGGYLWRYNPSNGVFNTLFYDNISYQIIGELAEGPDGKIWAGKAGNLDIICYNPTTGTVTTYPKPYNMSQYLIGGMEVTPDNRLYVCWTSNYAPFDLCKLDVNTGTWTKITLPSSLVGEYSCNKLIMGNDGCIYGLAARANGPIFKIDPKTDIVTSFGSQFPSGNWGANSRQCIAGAWAPTGRLYWGSSQDSAGNAHLFYFDRALPPTSNNGSTDNGTLPSDTRDIFSVAYYGGKIYFGTRQDSGGPRLFSFEVAGTAASPAISSVRAAANGTPVTLNTRVVTGAFGDHFYVEDADRLAGIKVSSGAAVTTGSMVSVTGTLATMDGERQISASAVAIYSGGNGVPEPWGWNVRNLGGGANGFVPGLTDSFGLNNVGLLGRVTGKVIGIGTGAWFYLDDGSNTPSDAPFAGVKVFSSMSVSLGQNVIVTGISSVDTDDGGRFIRALKARSLEDVRVLP